jgi:hypothetical protein
MQDGTALLPTVCAMALLPGGPVGLVFAPSALRHLMTDRDSPVADLYLKCAQCVELGQSTSKLAAELVQVRLFWLCWPHYGCLFGFPG